MSKKKNTSTLRLNKEGLEIKSTLYVNKNDIEKACKRLDIIESQLRAASWRNRSIGIIKL